MPFRHDRTLNAVTQPGPDAGSGHRLAILVAVAIATRLITFGNPIAAVAGQASLVIDRQRRGTPTEFATLVRAVGRGPGCLYVYSSSSMLYPATGRCAVSRYVFPSHLTRERETGAIGVDQAAELGRIFARAPEVVVMGPPYAGERSDIRADAIARLARDYRLAAQVPLGRKHVAVYRRVTPAIPSGYRLRFD